MNWHLDWKRPEERSEVGGPERVKVGFVAEHHEGMGPEGAEAEAT